MKLEPAYSIVHKLGGATKVANIVGKHRTRIYKWMNPREAGGSDGQIPFRYAPALIAAAKARGIALSAEDFLPVSKNDEAPAGQKPKPARRRRQGKMEVAA